MEKSDSNTAGHYFLGLVIIFFGVIYFLKALGYTLFFPWTKELLAALVLIFLGLSFLVRGKTVYALLGLFLGLGVIAALLHLMTNGAIWQQFK